MPWFDARNPVAPVIVKSVTTLGSLCNISSTRSWYSRICFGEEPSRAMNAPKITPLSPGGRNVFGTSMNSQIVPARQMTQITGEIQRCRRNHQSELP
jgi:hypothetical protein